MTSRGIISSGRGLPRPFLLLCGVDLRKDGVSRSEKKSKGHQGGNGLCILRIRILLALLLSSYYDGMIQRVYIDNPTIALTHRNPSGDSLRM